MRTYNSSTAFPLNQSLVLRSFIYFNNRETPLPLNFQNWFRHAISYKKIQSFIQNFKGTRTYLKTDYKLLATVKSNIKVRISIIFYTNERFYLTALNKNNG